MLEFQQYVVGYIPGVYLLRCRISGQHEPVCHIPVKYSIPMRCSAHKFCIQFVYTQKEKLKIKGGIKNHTVMQHVMQCMNDNKMRTVGNIG